MPHNPKEEVKLLRIGQFLSRAGYCSRREVVSFLKYNRVLWQGKRVLDPSLKISVNDELRVNDKKVILPPTNLIVLLNKPIGYTCSHREQKGQKSIFRLLPPQYAHIFFAGRLDVNSRGLVVLSYDGDLIYRLTHPSQNTEKEYLVTLSRPLSPSEEERTLKGIWDGKDKLKFQKIEQLKKAYYRLTLTEGKKHEIRRLFARLGVQVKDLQRVRLGTYQLPDIPEGQFKAITEKEN